MMKTRITRISKRSLSTFMAFLIMLTAIGIGSLITVTARNGSTMYVCVSDATMATKDANEVWVNVKQNENSNQNNWTSAKLDSTNKFYNGKRIYSIVGVEDTTWGGLGCLQIQLKKDGTWKEQKEPKANNGSWWSSSNYANKLYNYDSGSFVATYAEATHANGFTTGDYYIHNNVNGAWYGNGTSAPQMTKSGSIYYYDFYLKKNEVDTSNYLIFKFWDNSDGLQIGPDYESDHRCTLSTSGSWSSTVQSIQNYGDKDTAWQVNTSGWTANKFNRVRITLDPKTLSNSRNGRVKFTKTELANMDPTFSTTSFTKGTSYNLTNLVGVTSGSNAGTVSYSTYQYYDTSWHTISSPSSWTPSATNITKLRVTATDGGVITTAGTTKNAITARTETKETAITVSLATHTVSRSSAPSNGSLELSSDNTNWGTSSLTIAEGSNYYVKATPDTGYKINTLTVAGSTVSEASNSTSAYTHTGTMSTSNVTTSCTFSPQSYSITYKDQGDVTFSGTHASGYPTSHTYGTATNLKTASKTGYDFGGWYTTSDCSGSAVTSLGATAYTDNIILYAKWTIKSYTITLSEPGTTGGTLKVDGVTASTATHGSHDLRVDAPAGYEISSISSTGATWTNHESYATSSSVSITDAYTISVTYIKSANPALRIDYTGAAGTTFTATNGDTVTTSKRHAVTVTFTNQSSFDNGTAYTVTQKIGSNAATTIASGTTSSSGGDIVALTAAAGALDVGSYKFTVTVGSKSTYITVVVNQHRELTVNTASPASKISSISGTYTDEFGQTSQTISSTGTYYALSGTTASVTYTTSGYYCFSDSDNSTDTNTVSYSNITAAKIFAPGTIYEKKYTLTLNKTINGGTTTTTMASPQTLTPVSGSTVNYTAPTGYSIASWTVTEGTVYVGGTPYAATSTINTANNLSNVTLRGNAVIRANFTEDKYSVTLTDATHNGTVTNNAVGITTSYSVTAAAKSGYTFSNWTITGTGVSFSSGSASTASITFTARSAVTLVANYTETTYNIALSAEKCGTTNLGSVSPESGSAGVDTGLSATATAATGYEFVNWTGSNLTFTPNSASTTIKSTGGTAAQANFRQTRLYLDVHANTTWSGYSYYKAYFFNNGSDYTTGTTNGIVSMTAVPNTNGMYYVDIPSGYLDALTGSNGIIFFAQNNSSNVWDDNKVQTGNLTLSGKKNRYNIPASYTSLDNTYWDANAYIMETYYDVSVTVQTGGSVTYAGSDVSSGSTIKVSQNPRNLVATPAAGYVFSGWTTTGGAKVAGGTTSSSATVGATATADGTLTAAFTAVNHTINTSNGTYYTVSSSRASGILNQSVTITVSPSTGYKATSISATWASGSSAGTTFASSTNSNSLTFNIPAYSDTSDITISVAVDVITPTIKVNYVSNSSGSTSNATTATTVYTGSNDSNTITFTNGTSYPSGASYTFYDGSTSIQTGAGGSNATKTTTLAAGTHNLKISVTLNGTTKTSVVVAVVTKDKIAITLTEPSLGGVFQTSGKNVYNTTETKATNGTIYYAKNETITVSKSSGSGDLADVYVNGTSIGTGQQTFTANEAKTVTADFYHATWAIRGNGSGLSWDANNARFKYTDTANVYTLKLNVASTSTTATKFKIYDNGTWYTDTSFAATTDASGTFNNTTGGAADATFMPNAIGNYKFTFNSSTKALTLEYPKFELSLGTHTHATVSGTYPVDKPAGSTVSFTVTPDSGYSIAQVTYTPEGGSAQVISGVSTTGGDVSFTMPSADTQIAVTAVATPTVTPSSATLNKYAKEAFNLSYSTANNAQVTSISFAGTTYTSGLSSPKSLTVPEDLGLDSPYTGTKQYTITISYRHSTYTNITGTATVTVNATYTAVQKAYLLLNDQYTLYAGYDIHEEDVSAGWAQFDQQMTFAASKLTGLPASSVTQDSYTSRKNQLISAYNALKFKTTTIYALTNYPHNESNFVNIFVFNNNDTSNHYPTKIFESDTDLTSKGINNNYQNYHMTYEGITTNNKYLYSFTCRGHQEFIVYWQNTSTAIFNANNKLTGDIDCRSSAYGEYYVDVKDQSYSSSASTTTKTTFTDFSITATGPELDVGNENLVNQCKEGDQGYSVSNIKTKLGITYSGSLVTTSSQHVSQVYTVTPPEDSGLQVTEVTDSQKWKPTKPGRYTFSLKASVGSDNRGTDEENVEGTPTFTETISQTTTEPRTDLVLYVAYDEVEVYADMNGNVGTPTIHFNYEGDDYDESQHNYTDLPLEFDMVAGSESIYSRKLTLSTLKDKYGLDLIGTGSLTIQKISIDTVDVPSSTFTIDTEAARTGTLWLKADSTHMKTFNKIAYGSSTRTFKAVLRTTSGGVDTDAPFDNSFVDVSGTGIITDGLVNDNSYEYNVFYAAKDTTANYDFSYNVKAKALHDISKTVNSTTTHYFFDHWESINNSATPSKNPAPSEASGASVNITKAPRYTTDSTNDSDVTFVAVYKPVTTKERVEITYHFKDFDTSDGNYEFDSSKTPKDESYTKTVKLGEGVLSSYSSVTTANASNIAGAVVPIIQSNYFDYHFDSTTQYNNNTGSNINNYTIVYDSAKHKYKINAYFKDPYDEDKNIEDYLHTYKIVVINSSGSSSVRTGYYQQKLELKASDFGITSGSSYHWSVYDGSTPRTVASFDSSDSENYISPSDVSFTARFMNSNGVSDSKVQIIRVYSGTATVSASSSIMYSYSITYYDDDTEKAQHNFYIIDALTSSSGTLVGGGVLYATATNTTANGGTYRQTAAATHLASDASRKAYINNILNGTYDKEYKAQTINNVGFRYLPYDKGSDVFRYSDEMNAYVYTFAGTNTNNSSLGTQTLRVFSFFVYDNNGTKNVVVSSTYAECSRYVS